MISDNVLANISKALQENINTALQILNISYNDIHDAGATAISKCLKTNNSLQELNLSHNMVSNSGISDISKALQENKTLHILDISHNIIYDTGALAIGECLEINKSLQELNMSHNMVSNNGITVISKALERNETLQMYNISHNEYLSDDGAIAISECLIKSNALQKLNLSWNMTAKKSINKIAGAIVVNTSLQMLDLSSQYVSNPEYFVNTLFTAIGHNHTLIKLVLPTTLISKCEVLIKNEISKINRQRTKRYIETLVLDGI